MGCRCSDGRWEKDVTLSLARAIGQRLGEPVRLTRTDDVNLSLGERAELARASGADAFLSLHINDEGTRVWTHPRGGSRGRALGRALESQLGSLVPVSPCRDDVEMAVLAPERVGAQIAPALLELETPRDRQAIGNAVARGIAAWRGSNGGSSAAGAVRYGHVSGANVTCERYPREYPIFTAIGTDDPLGAINAAVDKAVALIEATTDELTEARTRVTAGEDPPVLRPVVATSLRTRLLIDPDRRATYTDAGPDTLEIVVRWLGNIRRILANDEVVYTCLGRENTDDNHGTPGDVRGPGAAHCMALFVADVNGIPNRNHVGLCGPGI